MIKTPIISELIIGALDLEVTPFGILPHRLPRGARERNKNQTLARMARQSAGIKLRFRTESTVIRLKMLTTRLKIKGFPERQKGIFDLCVDGRLCRQASAQSASYLLVDNPIGSECLQHGAPETIIFSGLPSKAKLVEIWLPHNETTELQSLYSDAPILPDAQVTKRVWLHHGSSISHGALAASPIKTWTAVASERAKVDLINLGFGGSALLDPNVAQVMCDTKADAISVKIGINLVNLGEMRAQDFVPAVEQFIDFVRSGHKYTPLLIISPIYCPIHECTPGPTEPDAEELKQGRLKFCSSYRPSGLPNLKLTLEFIRDRLQALVAQRSHSDKALHYLCGKSLYGEQDSQIYPLPDRLHPDTETHHLVGSRLAQRVFESGPFSDRFSQH